MVAAKIVIFCAIISVALSFTIPESEPIFEVQAPVTGEEALVRIARSPDEDPKRRVEANVEHHERHGTSAGVKYTHPVGKNLEVYAEAQRQFKYNDNSGRVGLAYRF